MSNVVYKQHTNISSKLYKNMCFFNVLSQLCDVVVHFQKMCFFVLLRSYICCCLFLQLMMKRSMYNSWQWDNTLSYLLASFCEFAKIHLGNVFKTSICCGYLAFKCHILGAKPLFRNIRKPKSPCSALTKSEKNTKNLKKNIILKKK